MTTKNGIEWVEIIHPDISGRVWATREAFDMSYSLNGWIIADDLPTPIAPGIPGPPGPPGIPGVGVYISGTQPEETTPWIWFDMADGDLLIIYEDGR